MSQPEILAVVVNWRRPANIPIVIDAVRQQTVPVHLAIVECAAGTPYGLPIEILREADQVYSVRHNIGARSRFIPPLATPEFRHTYFQVDDWAPGPRCLEWYLRFAESHPCFSTLGQDGRRVVGNQLSGRRIRPADKSTVVDVVCSSEFVRTDTVRLYADFASLMARFDVTHLEEDDLLLCLGLQKALLLPSVIVPTPPEGGSWRQTKLPAPFALSARGNHKEKRNQFIEDAIQLGWNSLT